MGKIYDKWIASGYGQINIHVDLGDRLELDIVVDL